MAILVDTATGYSVVEDRTHSPGFVGSSSVLKPVLLDSPPFRTLLPVIAKLDSLRAKAVVRALQRIELIHREGVVTMMPTEFVIR